MRAAGRGGRKGPCEWEGTEQAPAAAAPPPQSRAPRRWGPGGGGSAGRAAGGGEECGPGGRAPKRGAPAPELPSWRRAVLGDVTALESEECRAAGAPSAGPEKSHTFNGVVLENVLKGGGRGRRTG